MYSSFSSTKVAGGCDCGPPVFGCFHDLKTDKKQIPKYCHPSLWRLRKGPLYGPVISTWGFSCQSSSHQKIHLGPLIRKALEGTPRFSKAHVDQTPLNPHGSVFRALYLQIQTDNGNPGFSLIPPVHNAQ